MNKRFTFQYYLFLLLFITIAFFEGTIMLFAQTNSIEYFEEKDGFITVEAEDFHSQELDGIRKWYRVDGQTTPTISPDIDANHAAAASGGAYLEILPDTRTNHDEKLIHGENFTNEPGKMAILNYRVKFNTTGKYYVWVRAYSTGPEDNGIHVGIDGNWVESGQRMQWCDGKNIWAWASKQRTKEIHCGVEKLIYLNIETAGMHTISFSMREDGFEFDQWAMSQVYEVPQLVNQHYQKSQQWEVSDLKFRIKESMENPLAVNFGAMLTHESGQTVNVPGFYNGDKFWTVRFAPAFAGNWTGLTYSSLAELAGKKVKMTILPNQKKDRHGPIKVNKKNPQRFVYADDTPYFLTAFECDWLFALDYGNKEGIPKTTEMVSHIKANGFNQIVMNVYAYNANWGNRDRVKPEHNYAKPNYSPFGGTNDNPDHSTLNIEFFQHLDRVLAHLNEQEIVSHLMIYVWNKNVNWPEPNSEADNLYFDYVVKRYQAYPNLIWDISKEALGYGRDDMNYITNRIDRLRKMDGHQRLLSVHDYAYCATFPDKVDFISIQDWKPNLYDAMLFAAKLHPNKPIFNIEHGGYETTQHRIFNGAYSDPTTCLERNYQCVFAGAYSTYYWQNASWYEVVYDPMDLPESAQPKLSWYKNMIDFFEQYNYAELESTQFTFSPFCLTDHESVYLFHIPLNTEIVTGYIPELKGKTMLVKWFDPFTGKSYPAKDVAFTKKISFRSYKDKRITAPFAIAILEVKSDNYQFSAINDFESITVEGFVSPYIDKNRQAIAINAAKFKNKYTAVTYAFKGNSGKYHLQLTALAELDGESNYRIAINGQLLESTKTNPRIFGTGISDYAPVSHVWENVELKKGHIIRVEASSETNGKIPEGDTTAYSRGRFTEIKLVRVE